MVGVALVRGGAFADAIHAHHLALEGDFHTVDAADDIFVDVDGGNHDLDDMGVGDDAVARHAEEHFGDDQRRNFFSQSDVQIEVHNTLQISTTR